MVPLVPVLLVRLVSNSAATGLVLDIIREFGTDSFIGLAGGLLATAAGAAASIFLAGLMA